MTPDVSQDNQPNWHLESHPSRKWLLAALCTLGLAAQIETVQAQAQASQVRQSPAEIALEAREAANGRTPTKKVTRVRDLRSLMRWLSEELGGTDSSGKSRSLSSNALPCLPTIDCLAAMHNAQSRLQLAADARITRDMSQTHARIHQNMPPPASL